LALSNSVNVVNGRGRAMVEGNFAPSFALAMARKDVQLMLETAGDEPLALLPGFLARIDAMMARGHGGDDLSVVGRES
jgi:3-hydroxyisobutyrate dehydrogenase-like beta-hydroxyacid dehydrogenase